ncbi:Bgt-1049 [Blumeria graminis f. sp. tritici]|nr:Bgt-1049 [Blumeria graminis f. sp. tritici]
MGTSVDIFLSAKITENKINASTQGDPPSADAPVSKPFSSPAEKQESKQKKKENYSRRELPISKATIEVKDINSFSRTQSKEPDDIKNHFDITPGGSPCRKRQRIYGDR